MKEMINLILFFITKFDNAKHHSLENVKIHSQINYTCGHSNQGEVL